MRLSPYQGGGWADQETSKYLDYFLPINMQIPDSGNQAMSDSDNRFEI